MALPENVNEVCKQLVYLAEKLDSSASTNKALSAWNLPALSKSDFSSVARNIAEKIRISCDNKELDRISEEAIVDLDKRIKQLTEHSVPQLWAANNSQYASVAIICTLFGVEQVFSPMFESWVNHENLDLAPKSLSQRIRGIEGQLNQAEPKLDELITSIKLIKDARATANQLPVDLEMLRQNRLEFDRIRVQVEGDAKAVTEKLEAAREALVFMTDRLNESENLISQLRELHRIGTSTTLAGAFQKRANDLSNSVWVWVAILVAALIGGCIVGGFRIHEISEVMRSETVNWQAVWINLAMTVLGVSAPVWLAWVATKHIAQRFKLAEDYAYKASISNAYEGYRREAINLDEDFQSRLFGSALTRLDEVPGRLVESKSYGSPLHELMESDAVKMAVSAVPNFVDTVKGSAMSALDALKVRKGAPSDSRQGGREKKEE